MTAKLSLYVTAIMLAAILTVGVGCTKAPNDAQTCQRHPDQTGFRLGFAGQAN
jgi:hypothetical protein